MFRRLISAPVLLALSIVPSSLLAGVALTVNFSGARSTPQQALLLALSALTGALLIGLGVFMRHAVIKTTLMAGTLIGAWYFSKHVSDYLFIHYNGAVFAITVASVTYIFIVLAYEMYDYYAGPLLLSELTQRMQTSPRGTLYKLQQPKYVQELVGQLTDPAVETPMLLDLIGLYLSHTPCYSLFGYKNWQVQVTSVNPRQQFTELTKQNPFGLISQALIILTIASVGYQFIAHVYRSIHAPETISARSMQISLTIPVLALLALFLFKMYRRHQLTLAIRRLRNFYLRCNHLFAGHYHTHFRLMRFTREIEDVNAMKGVSRGEKTAASARLLIDFFTTGRRTVPDYALPERWDMYEAILTKLNTI